MAPSWLPEHCRLCCNNSIICDSKVNPDLVRRLILVFSEVRLGAFPPYLSASSEGRTTYGNDVSKRQSCADFSLLGQGQHPAVSGRDLSSVIYTSFCALNGSACRAHRLTQKALKTFFSPILFPYCLILSWSWLEMLAFFSSPSIPLTLTRHGLHLIVYPNWSCKLFKWFIH